MNFRDNYQAALKANDQEQIDNLDAQAWEYAYARACELDSPNSIGFDALRESIYEELMEHASAA